MEKQKKKGISLIVLVITIIVMIILAASVIISLNNAGIIGNATHATEKTRAIEIKSYIDMIVLTNKEAKYSKKEMVGKTDVVNQLLNDGKITTTEAETLKENDIIVIEDVEIDFSGLKDIINAQELTTKLSEGGVVEVTNNLVLEDTLSITKDTTMNLNGNVLAVNDLDLAANIVVNNGTLKVGELEYTNEYGYSREIEPQISINGEVTLNNVEFICDEPCTLVINNNSGIEIVGLRVASGKLTLNNSNITVKNDTIYGNSLQLETILGIAVEGTSQLEINGGSLKIEGKGGTSTTTHIPIYTVGAGTKTLTINGCTFNMEPYVQSVSGTTIINTTDAEGSWEGKCAGTGYVVNYISE